MVCGKSLMLWYLDSDEHLAVVYRAHNIINDQEVAIKLELCTTGTGRMSSVKHEYNVLKQLEGAAGFPRPLWFGREASYYALVIDNLGPSLYNIFLSCDRKFSLHNVIILGEQLVSISDSKHTTYYKVG